MQRTVVESKYWQSSPQLANMPQPNLKLVQIWKKRNSSVKYLDIGNRFTLPLSTWENEKINNWESYSRVCSAEIYPLLSDLPNLTYSWIIIRNIYFTHHPSSSLNPLSDLKGNWCLIGKSFKRKNTKVLFLISKGVLWHISRNVREKE